MRLIRRFAEGRADGLAGRCLNAEHDADLESLVARLDDVRERDLHAVAQRGSCRTRDEISQ